MERAIIDKSKIMIGSDIEVFLRDPKTGKFISGIGMIGGTKENPRPLERKGCCVQEDNVALEYNVPAVMLIGGGPEMAANIAYVIDTVRKEGTVPADLQIVCCSSATFDEAQLDNPKAQEFGCEPDYNAWENGLPNERPFAATNLRSCGGHIHISYPGANMETSLELVKIFDLFLGVPSVLIDSDTERRRLYGKAGAHRIKEFGADAAGFEYRVLSNWWSSNATYTNWIFSQIEKAIDFYNENGTGVYVHEAEILRAINKSDADVATLLCTEFGIVVPEKIEENAQINA